LIWDLRCERVIQGKPLSEEEIRTRWYHAINEQLKVTATKIKRNSTFMKLTEETWGPALRKERNYKQTGYIPVRF